ncbi:MAG TPA: hypothetical protein VHO70_05990 [Chitinispirillaceae bacterium]|nr:hypothetical protein [Chitinispirillaceae bacterium]
MYKSLFALVMAFSIVANAGPNSNAALYINFGSDTSKIDSVTYHSVSDTFTAAIMVKNADSLHAFQFFVGFDTSALKFVSGQKDNGILKNFLETQRGAVSSFICGYSRTDSTKISIGVSLQGNNKNECPYGSGFLAFLKFIKKNTDTTTLNIQSPLLLTIDEVEDTKMGTFSGTIYPGSSGIIKRNAVKPRFSIQKTDNMVTIYTQEITPQSIQLFTVDGRCLTKISSNTQRTSIPLPSIISKGPCVIRIQCNNNRYSSLMINN